MGTRTWSNVSTPSGDKTYTIWMKTTEVSGDFRLVSSLSNTINYNADGNEITVDGNAFSSLTALNDDNWHLVTIAVSSNDDVDVYIDESLVPNSTNIPGVSDPSTGDFVIGDAGIDLFSVRVLGQKLDLSTFRLNYLYKDVIENSGNAFYDGV